jgi:PAS domain S-box-containing protein
MSERPGKEVGLELPIHRATFWRTAVQCVAGTIAIALITFVCFRIQVNLATAVCLFLIIVVLLSLQGNFFSSAIVALIAGGCFLYFLSPPIFTFEISDPSEVVVLVVFLIISALITNFVSRVRKASEALREQANLLNLTHDTIFVRDMNNLITYWNRGAEELYGWTAAEVIGKVTTHKLLQTVLPAPLDEIEKELHRTGRWEGELKHTKADGTHVVVASRWSLQRDEGRRPLAILELNNDITERKQTQDSLEQAQANLARVNRVMLVGEMTASIAHEVNQPIAAAVTNAGACLRWLAAQPPDMEKAHQALERIVRDGSRAAEVIGRVRALVKKVPPRTDLFDINDAILEVVAMTQSELQKHVVDLRTHLSSEVPLVTADRVQLQQVVLNLIVNAIDAMNGVGNGPRELVVGSGRSDPADVFVEVRDSGPGLDQTNLNRVFDSFYTTKQDGMGMGLSISRSIIDAHGGRLWATPNEPHGAVFRFTLPLGGGGDS